MTSSLTTPTRTLRLRLKDKHAGFLREQARSVNFVWNYCNELSVKHFERTRRFLSAYDMQPYTKGAGAELALHSQTVQAVQEEYVTRRKQFKKVKLRWRVSGGARRSLGWIPFKASAIRYRGGQVWYGGRALSLWDSYGLSQFELGSGSFSEDSRGRWYLNVTVKRPVFVGPQLPRQARSVGVDLGLKDFMATSDGEKVEAQRFYRGLEADLAVAQRANKKQRVKAIHAKIANRRKDALHKLSTRLVNEYGAIFIGNVNAAGLAKTRMAKSVLDAGWSTFRTMLLRLSVCSSTRRSRRPLGRRAASHWSPPFASLRLRDVERSQSAPQQYKCDDAGVWFEEVDEAYSTQTCSCCGSRTGPKGVAGLGMRGWTCSECGAEHDRDLNAAKNILAAGRGRLAEGILALPAHRAAAVG